MDNITHPTSDCVWDQRIPNEPIQNRQFFVDRPPILIQDRPRNTRQIPVRCENPWIMIQQEDEQQLMEYWYNNTVNTEIKGVNTPHPVRLTMEEAVKRFPNRPWLYSDPRNVLKESHLTSRNYYNPNDCIVPCVRQSLDVYARVADDAMMKEMVRAGTRRDHSGMRLWNIPTSPKMTQAVQSRCGHH